jgi:hypothetical protein
MAVLKQLQTMVSVPAHHLSLINREILNLQSNTESEGKRDGVSAGSLWWRLWVLYNYWAT